MIYVTAEVDEDEVLGELEDEVLLKACRERGISLSTVSPELRTVLEDLYYALRDNDLEKAIKVINPILDKAIGRQV